MCLNLLDNFHEKMINCSNVFIGVPLIHVRMGEFATRTGTPLPVTAGHQATREPCATDVRDPSNSKLSLHSNSKLSLISYSKLSLISNSKLSLNSNSKLSLTKLEDSNIKFNLI